MSQSRSKVRASRLLIAAAALAVPVIAASPGITQSSREHEVTVTINRVKALDAMDVFSRADFFARVTIAGAVQAVPPVKQKTEIEPNWTISKKVPPGRHNVKLEIFDKDLTKEEPVDINRVPGKRHQDFTINTRSCTIGGFSGSPRCGTSITRAGDERKKAEVTFTVTVKK